ncbi:MAG: Dyp-type peroxidase [Hyphomicrobiales bacterium]
MNRQLGILPGIPNHGRFIELAAISSANISAILKGLVPNERLVIGLGAGLVQNFAKVEGLHGFKSPSGSGVEIPSTQADLWIWIRGDDRGEIAKRARAILEYLNEGFEVVRTVDGFKYGIDLEVGLDLSGYEDGTENPEGEEAIKAAFALDDSSFVSVQKWEHDISRLHSFKPEEQDDIIGRRILDNEEIESAPEFAHVKRTAQEDFTPEAFILRRSMPWVDAGKEGLMFVAFGCSFNAFEALLSRMVGVEDGIVDGLFLFSLPTSGANYWCPPVKAGHLDLSRIGI